MTRQMEELARKALKGIDEDFGYYPGYRAAQAKGTLCHGMFTAGEEAAALTTAVHLQPGAVTPVTARFSNFTSNPMRHDGSLDVRGMATAFHLGDGTQTDIVCLRMSRFVVGTAREFLAFERAIRRNPWGDLPLPGRWFFIYVATGRLPWDLGLRQIVPLCRVASYAGSRYNSLHAFRWVDASGHRRHVRYSWVPEAREQKLHWWQTRRKDPDYLRAEMAARMAQAPVRFRLEVEVAGHGDNASDASAKWPKGRERIEVGALELTEPGAWPAAGGDELRFEPTRVTAGIQVPEGDDLLMLRKHVYALSARRRIGHAERDDGDRRAIADPPVAPAAEAPRDPAEGDPVERPRIARVNGIDICYETGAPGGRPLLLIMGFACSMIWWHRDFREMFERHGFRVIRFDNRDSGRSSHDFRKVGKLRGMLFPRRFKRYTVDDMADDAAALLAELGIRDAHVMGVSLGGMIAQALAIRHPDRVLSLTSINASPVWRNWPPARMPTPRVLWRLMKPQPTRSEARWVRSSLRLWRLLNASSFRFDEDHVRGLLHTAWHWGGGVDSDADLRQMVAVRGSDDRTPGLRALRMPALVIHGSDDPLIRLAGGIDTRDAIRGARWIPIEGMGHYTPRKTWGIVVDGVTRLAEDAERVRAGEPE
jgi:pimeloyl-ACP methyl ester carboxylesterase